MIQLRNLSKNKPLFGISIYPNKASIKEIISYMNMAWKYGFKRVFTNLIGLSKKELDNFKKICLHGSQMGFNMIADIDETVLKLFDIKLEDTTFFKNIGIQTIRLDVKFKPEDVARLSLNKEGIEIEVNASDFSEIEKEIVHFEHNHNKIIASHNFFPQKYTGLSYQKFEKANQSMKEANFKVSAFSSITREDVIDAWDESEGAVTLEALRNMCIVDQFQFLMACDHLDYIIVSNMFLTEAEFKAINKLSLDKIIFNGIANPNITKEELKIFDYSEHKIRGDNPGHLFFRSTISRKIFKDLQIEPQNHNLKFFNPGDVVILNNEYGRYKGELHIIKKQIKASNKKNLVGSIFDQQLLLLDLERPLLKFEIRRKGGDLN